MKLHKKIILKYILTLETGLHIGDSKENADIGGVDSPVVRRKDNNHPYLPGSSIKGKIRSLLELAYGANSDSNFKNYEGKSEVIAKLFGTTQANVNNPSRIIVRDAYLTEDSVKKFKDNEFTDLPFTEVKIENVIDRVKGVTKNGGLRQIERVPAGAEFNVEIVINIFDPAQEESFKELLNLGIILLENDYLGGSGSRGYGKVKIKDVETQELLISKLIENVN